MSREKVHFYIYLSGLIIIAFFLPLSEYIPNAAIFLLLANWILEFNFKEKIKRIWLDKTVIVFLLIFFVHVLWLWNTSNFDYAFKDIRIKLSLLALPIIISSSEKLNIRQLHLILYSFIVGVLLSTVWGMLAAYQNLSQSNIFNIRNLSIFISHIRLSLMISFSILIIIYFWSKRILPQNLFVRITAAIILIWFFAFLILLQGFTGITALVVAGWFVIGVKAYYEKKKSKKIIYLVIFLLIPILVIVFIWLQIKEFYKPTSTNKLLEYTSAGNPYYHAEQSGMLENGNLVYINICEKELQWAWSRRSKLSLDSKDAKGQELLHTLIRYLSSKGLNKDAEGVFALTDADVYNIENGCTNYRFTGRAKIQHRIYTIIWQIDYYLKGGNPSGHSITQRIEYLKYGIILSYHYFLTGIGTGDIDDAFKLLYIEKRSEIEPQFRHRTHNQFISFFVSFGVFGFILILLGIFYPIFYKIDNLSWPIISFLIIVFLSMLSDDTLETTTGALFFSYFYSLFMWGFCKDNHV